MRRDGRSFRFGPDNLDAGFGSIVDESRYRDLTTTKDGSRGINEIWVQCSAGLSRREAMGTYIRALPGRAWINLGGL